MNLFNTLLLFGFALCCGVTTLNAQNVLIPNANFKTYLVGNAAINTNGDTEIQVSEAIAFSGMIDCSTLTITDLTGIEAFVNLTSLDCAGNQINNLNVTQNTSLEMLWCTGNPLTSLDVTQNTNLVKLVCYWNSLTGLDVTQNTSLEELDCRYSPLMSLDVTQNTNLKVLWCGNNQLSNLDVTQNTNLEDLWCSDNNLSSLDVSQNINLINLRCYWNQLSILDVTQNFSLTEMDCRNNQLSTLDLTQNINLEGVDFSGNQFSSINLTQNPNLTHLYCESNQLSTLDVTQNTGLAYLLSGSNQLSSLDLTQNTNLIYLDCTGNNLLSELDVKNGNNSNFIYFDATNNPNLLCIQVDDSIYSTSNWLYLPQTATFSTNCNAVLNVYIPDTIFKTDLLGNSTINTNGDGEIQFTEAAAYNSFMDVSNLGIVDLTGIEAFIHLTGLDCSGNQLSSLDITQNVNLQSFYCDSNNLSSLDVAQNINLTRLHCEFNPLLSELDVKNGNNSNFLSFDATNNPNLLCIQVDDSIYSTTNWLNIDATATFSTNCGALLNVYIPDANFKANLVGNLSINTNGDVEIQFTEAAAYTGLMDVSNHTIADLTGIEAFVNLTDLDCSGNNLIDLNLSQNTSLMYLDCTSNLLIGLDLNQNLNLIEVTCNLNQLSSLEVKNGNNTNVTIFDATDNPNLICIEVDDSIYSATNWTNIDTTATFSENCGLFLTVYIPDANFRASLLSDLTINTNGDGGIQFTEAGAYTGVMDVSNLGIIDLTGIEAFLALTTLRCDSNDLSTLDVTQNTSLTELSCSYNHLTNLDVTQNTNLTELNCQFNDINSVDLLQNTSLTDLECGGNNLNSLNVTQNTGLTYLGCGFNNLTNIDLTQNTSLTSLYCSGNDLIALGVLQNTNLTSLFCTHNNLSTLDVTQNTSLIDLSCTNNNLSSLNVSQNNSLEKLMCFDNQLTSLDLTQNTNLDWFYCQTNQISSLDLSQNTNLTRIACSDNNLISLNARNGNNTNVTTFYAENNPNLSCIEVDDSIYSTANWTNIDSAAMFNVDCSLISSHKTIVYKKVNLSIYPNPTTKEITLDFGKFYQEANIQVTNLTGQIVLNKTVENNSTTRLELEGAAGVYFVKIETEEGTATLKVIKE